MEAANASGTTSGCGGSTATVDTRPHQSTNWMALDAASATYVPKIVWAILYGLDSTMPGYCGGPKNSSTAAHSAAHSGVRSWKPYVLTWSGLAVASWAPRSATVRVRPRWSRSLSSDEPSSLSAV